jgi:uncharacterized protein YaaQ
MWQSSVGMLLEILSPCGIAGLATVRSQGHATNEEQMMDNPICLLMLAIVQEQDLDVATRAIGSFGAPVVYLASAGGFLGRRNATILIGLPKGREEDVLRELRKTCRQRVEYLSMPLEGSPLPMPTPIPVTVGGATVFALPVERFEEI